MTGAGHRSHRMTIYRLAQLVRTELSVRQSPDIFFRDLHVMAYSNMRFGTKGQTHRHTK